MAWELLEKQKVGRNAEPKLTIKKNGLISLNVEARKLLKTDFVEVYFDAGKNKVGLKGVPKTTNSAVKVNKGVFSAKSFLSGKYDFTGNKRFDVKVDKEYLVINLNEGVDAPTRTRKTRDEQK